MTGMVAVNEAFGSALERAATQLLGNQLDGPFSVISYPPGYNFFVQFGSPVYYNAATLGVIDQLCAEDANGIVNLTGGRLSTTYQNVLQAVVFNQSTADKNRFQNLQAQFDEQGKVVISSFEAAFGAITQKQIDDSQCFPANKIGYIQYIITKQYGDPPKIPPAFAGFSSNYSQWITQGQILQSIASRVANAQAQLQTAITNTTSPSATSGGWQTGAFSYAVAYTGLPAVTAITGSLTSTNRQLSVNASLANVSQNGSDVSIDGNAIAQGLSRVADIAFGRSALTRSLESFASPGSNVDILIVYPGITILRADPQELSADLVTGWYSRDILSEVIQKTGQDVTGFQLQGSEYSVDKLFGPGKTFARVKTFVVSQEPTVQLTFYNSDVRASFKPGAAVQLQLADVVTIGATSSGSSVQKVDLVNGNTVVTLGPPTISGTIPPPQQTAYIIGGVVDYAQGLFASPQSGSISLHNSGGFFAALSVQYLLHGKTTTDESGDFPVLVTRVLQLPADATDIVVTVKIATFINTWSVVATYRYDRPVTKSFEVSGTTGSPAIKEI